MARFDRAKATLTRSYAGDRPALARVAADCGHADQAHLAREFRALAGCPPSQWLAEEFRFVQGTPDRDPEGNRWSFGTYRGEPRRAGRLTG